MDVPLKVPPSGQSRTSQVSRDSGEYGIAEELGVDPVGDATSGGAGAVRSWLEGKTDPFVWGKEGSNPQPLPTGVGAGCLGPIVHPPIT